MVSTVDIKTLHQKLLSRPVKFQKSAKNETSPNKHKTKTRRYGVGSMRRQPKERGDKK